MLFRNSLPWVLWLEPSQSHSCLEHRRCNKNKSRPRVGKQTHTSTTIMENVRTHVGDIWKWFGESTNIYNYKRKHSGFDLNGTAHLIHKLANLQISIEGKWKTKQCLIASQPESVTEKSRAKTKGLIAQAAVGPHTRLLLQMTTKSKHLKLEHSSRVVVFTNNH